MLRTLCPLAVALLLPGLARAQAASTWPAPPAGAALRDDPTWRLSLATGTATAVEILDAFFDELGNGLGPLETSRTGRTELVLRADQERGRLRLGGSYTYTTWDTRTTDALGPRGAAHDQVHALLLHAFVRWVDVEHVELYSGVGAGLAWWATSSTLDGARTRTDGVWAAWQLHLLGLGLGTPSLRAFAEVGLGFEGLLVAGLAGRF